MTRAPWWRDAVFYQIYPRSYADSNDDGVGDLRGIVARFDHLRWLGIDGIWVNPIMESPNDDWGYDISNYKRVHPELGTLDDVDDLIAAAGMRGIKVVFDLVPNHTSDRHPWFHDALTGRDARHRDWYVWADPAPGGGPPNNWLSVFGSGSAWQLHEGTAQYYLHNFLPSQPDLNWWNDDVRDAFDDILRFWFDRGVAGFRIDVAHGIVKDRELRDNLPATEEDHPRIRRVGQRPVYNMNRPEVHEVFRRWRMLSDTYDDKRIIIGETLVLDLEQMAAYYGGGDDELNLAFNFPFALSDFDATLLRAVVETTEKLIPPQGWPAWMGSNHDIGRFPSRWCSENDDAARCVLMMLLCMRGTPFLYCGDEIGMPHTELRREDVKDPVGIGYWAEGEGRDPCRTPMHWSPEEGAGFTSPGVDPWLPLGDYRTRNVADQRGDPHSMLTLCRDLIALRRESVDLRRAPYDSLPSPPGAWAWCRGDQIVIALNLTDRSLTVDDVGGTVLIGTRRERDGERVMGAVELRAWEGVVLRRS